MHHLDSLNEIPLLLGVTYQFVPFTQTQGENFLRFTMNYTQNASTQCKTVTRNLSPDCNMGIYIST